MFKIKKQFKTIIQNHEENEDLSIYEVFGKEKIKYRTRDRPH